MAVLGTLELLFVVVVAAHGGGGVGGY